MKKLSDLKNAGVTTIRNVKGPEMLRLLEMGLTPGSKVEVVRAAPLGFPIEVKIRGYLLSLRKSEAECIEIE
ncbi:FeoA family protein [Rhodohalobacter sp. 614A]|uniref:FeoA family protein n=1 Tax=Rhodohalobacter sp. 614A TaxID=2908649 RepID=UPI001F407B36|nr:FeoA family protein [Rhodohalobacter sp. 614A]